MQKMIADAKLRNDGEWIYPGRKFTCSDGDAADLEAMKMAHKEKVMEKVAEVAHETMNTMTRAVTAGRGRNQYQRRDLQAAIADATSTKDEDK